MVMLTNRHTRSYFDGIKHCDKIWAVDTQSSLVTNNTVVFIEVVKNSVLHHQLKGTLPLTGVTDFDSLKGVRVVVNVVQ